MASHDHATTKKTEFTIYFIYIMVVLLSSCCFSEGSDPLNTKDFYKQIYSDVCSSGDLACLRDVITDSFQLSLPRNHGAEVSSGEKVQLFGETESVIKTLSHNPPIFEIENFFTADECDFVIELAMTKKLKRRSITVNGKTMFKDDIDETFKMWNLNGDDFVDAKEVAYVYGKSGVFVTEDNVLDMFKSINIDTDENGKLDTKEFQDIDHGQFEHYVNEHILNERNSKTNPAFISQAWLWHDEDELLGYEDVLENYHERVAKVTKLPKKLIEHSEPVQVIKYEAGAHDECHHDTQSFSSDIPCCQYGSRNCRVCRYLTISVFLTDDFGGGEKCFPFAGNETFSQKDLPREYLKKCNLASSCDACNVKIKPKVGKAVMWYNHLLNRNGWMGALDAFAGHGDCKTTNAEKWVANIWIDVIGDGKRELRSWMRGTNWLKAGNKDAEIYTSLGKPELKPDTAQVKERYSATRNGVVDTNIKIGDTDVHFNKIKAEKVSTCEKSGSVKHTPGSSPTLQAILLLLDELSETELGFVAERVKSKTKSTT